jgi:flagellar protein FliO/FliZ
VKGESMVHSSWKKWMILVTALILVLAIPLTTAHASEKTVYDQFHQNSQQDSHSSPAASQVAAPSMGVSVFQFIFSFILIIGLLYWVLRYVSRKTKNLNSGGIFHGLGGHSLGGQRSVQMVMIGDTLYILGVGDNVQLIRTIPPGEEQTKMLESVSQTQVVLSEKWRFNWKEKWELFKQRTKKEKWEEHLSRQIRELQSKKNNNNDPS